MFGQVSRYCNLWLLACCSTSTCSRASHEDHAGHCSISPKEDGDSTGTSPSTPSIATEHIEGEASGCHTKHQYQYHLSIADIALLLFTLAFTTVNPVKVLRRLTPSWILPSAPFPPPQLSRAPPPTITTTNPSTSALPASPVAKLSSTLLQRPGALTFAEATGRRGEDLPSSSLPPCVQSAERKMSLQDKRRRRRSSSLMYQEPPESLEQQSDQAVLPNLNAQWVNAKGTR